MSVTINVGHLRFARLGHKHSKLHLSQNSLVQMLGCVCTIDEVGFTNIDWRDRGIKHPSQQGRGAARVIAVNYGTDQLSQRYNSTQRCTHTGVSIFAADTA